MTTLAQALKQAIGQLHMHEQARLESEVLLAHTLNKSRAYLHAWPEAELSQDQEALFRHVVQRRAAGQPVAYLTGHREFWSLNFEVTPDTLIPRPETELLVERTLATLAEDKALRVADLGTGSGAIAIALAHERRHWKLLATDRFPRCLQLAQRNARRVRVNNVCFIQADWSSAFADRSLDAIVSNPPYIADQDTHLLHGDVRFEPAQALTSGSQGLDDVGIVISEASRVLKPAGWILLEHAIDQAEHIHNLLINKGFAHIKTFRDIRFFRVVQFTTKPT